MSTLTFIGVLFLIAGWALFFINANCEKTGTEEEIKRKTLILRVITISCFCIALSIFLTGMFVPVK